MAACPVVSTSLSPPRRRRFVLSPRRIEANRRNAARSTGPRTSTGKARVARNAIKHGFFVAPHRWTPEQRHDFESTYAGLRDDFRPDGIGEESCVWTIAHSYVRMAAVFRYESIAAYEYHQQCEREFDARIASATPTEARQLRAHRERMRKAGLWGPTLPAPRAVNGIARCMGNINHEIRRAGAELRGFQSFRTGEGPRTRHPTKVRKQTHLTEENRTFSLLDTAARAHRELLKTARAPRPSSSAPGAAGTTSKAPSTIIETAKTNPLSSTFTGNRHARRRAAALARRRI
ncbi:MAG TPA: hypothetical protein VKV03_13675 [Candidatus Binataceae bacterium]|nr:hypothetical protein [Candidatus Binataceae bacterium]